MSKPMTREQAHIAILKTRIAATQLPGEVAVSPLIPKVYFDSLVPFMNRISTVRSKHKKHVSFQADTFTVSFTKRGA
jgi:hypothetical protein